MARYDITCSSCKTISEITKSMADNSPLICPICKGEAQRVFTPSAITGVEVPRV